MGKIDELEAALQISNPIVQQFVVALEDENRALHRKIAKLEAKNVSAQSRIRALQENLNEKEEILNHSDDPGIDLDEFTLNKESNDP